MQFIVYRPDEFDRACRAARQPDDVVVLSTDVVTAGPWGMPDNCHLAVGVHLAGQGHTITLQPDYEAVCARPDRDVGVLHAAGGNEVTDLTLDGNEKAFRGDDGRKILYITTGLRCHGRLNADRVGVRGLRGTWKGNGTQTREIEAFGFSTLGPEGGSQLHRCGVTQCPGDAYVTGFCIGHAGSDAALSYLSSCGAEVEPGNWAAFALNQNVDVHACHASGFRIGVYCDTGPCDRVIVRGCNFKGVSKLVGLVDALPPNPATGPARRGFVSIRNCNIDFAAGPSHLLEAWDKCGSGAALGPVLFDQCSATKSDSPSQPLYVARAGRNIAACVIAGCDFPPIDRSADGAHAASYFEMQ